MMINPTAFSSHVSGQLKYYVYRLIDPRNGETFYVGKGIGNRVFNHAAGELTTDIDADNAPLPNKLERIRQIKLSGCDVQHVIHRHGLDDKTAFEVEAALIDAYPGLTNAVAGHGSDAFGAMHAIEVIELYEAKDAEFCHDVIMITVNRSAAEVSPYEAVRYAWKLDVRKAEKADYVLAVVQGIIVGVFVADRWLPATADNFQGRPDRLGRNGFEGGNAPTTICEHYLRRRVPAEFRKRGAANPVKYAFRKPSGH